MAREADMGAIRGSATESSLKGVPIPTSSSMAGEGAEDLKAPIHNIYVTGKPNSMTNDTQGFAK